MSDIRPRVGLELDIPEITAAMNELEKKVLGSGALKKVEQNFKKSQDFLTSYQIAQTEKRLKTTEKVTALETQTVTKEAAKQKQATERLVQSQIELTLYGARKKQQVLTEQGRFQSEMMRREERANKEQFDRLKRDIQSRLNAKQQEENLVEKILRRREAAEKKHQDTLRKIQESNDRVRERFDHQQLRNQERAEAREDARRRRRNINDARHAFGGKESDGKSYSSWRDRNIIGGLGVLKASAVTSLVSKGISALGTLFSHAQQADDAIDDVDVALSKVGVTNKGLRDDMIATGSEIANDFAKRTTEVNKLQALVAGYGGQLGATNKRIVELALANERVLGVPAENLAKMFAKATDPENEASLSRLGLVFKKGATEAERFAAINERFGKSVDTAKKTTQDGVGNMQRTLNNFNDTIAKLANSLINILGPAITGIGKVILTLLSPIEKVMNALGDLFEETNKAASLRIENATKKQESDYSKMPKTAAAFRDYLLTNREAFLRGEGTLMQDVKKVITPAAYIALSNGDIDKFNQEGGLNALGNIILSRSNRQLLEREAEAGSNTIDKVQKQYDDLLKAKGSMPHGLFLGEAERLKGMGAKDPAAPDKPKGKTIEQIRRELFEEQKQALERQKKELLITEFKYYEELIKYATLYHQKRERLDAESELRILNRLGRASGRFPAMPILDLQAKHLHLAGGANSPWTTDKFLKSLDGKDKFNTDATPFWRGGKGFMSDAELKGRGLDEDAVQRSQDKFSQWTSIISPVESAFGSLFQNLQDGFYNSVLAPLAESKNAFQNFVAGFLNGLTSMISGLLSKAAILALLSLIPGVGPAITAGGGFFPTLLKMSSGGTVPGQDRGVDEVPALLRPTETVLNPSDSKTFNRMGGLSMLRGGGPMRSIRFGSFLGRNGVTDGNPTPNIVYKWNTDTGLVDSTASQKIFSMDSSSSNYVYKWQPQITDGNPYRFGLDHSRAMGANNNAMIAAAIDRNTRALAQRETLMVDTYSMQQFASSQSNSRYSRSLN